MASKLGIVVVDYHTPDHLKQFCISLIQAECKVPYFFLIQVVDSQGMESVSAGELAGLFDQRSLVAGVSSFGSNVGYNVAANEGAKWMLELPVDPADMTLAFFNSDTRLVPGVIESCVDLLWSDDSFAAVGPRQIDDSGRITAGGIFGTLDHPRHRGWQEPAGEKYQDVRTDCVTIAGSAYFIKAPVWQELSNCHLYKEVDGDSTGAFLCCRHYYGETFCSYHAHAHHYKVVYNGSVTMEHLWHKASPISSSSPGERYLTADRQLFRKACDNHGILHD